MWITLASLTEQRLAEVPPRIRTLMCTRTHATGTGYIDGFTDGLKGASVGDVIDCDVTFPDDYGNTDLAGKAVVFTFTVNSIQKEMTIDDVDDAFAKEQFQVDTVDEMYDQIRSYMESVPSIISRKTLRLPCRNYLIDNCEAGSAG